MVFPWETEGRFKSDWLDLIMLKLEPLRALWVSAFVETGLLFKISTYWWYRAGSPPQWGAFVSTFEAKRILHALGECITIELLYKAKFQIHSN